MNNVIKQIVHLLYTENYKKVDYTHVVQKPFCYRYYYKRIDCNRWESNIYRSIRHA